LDAAEHVRDAGDAQKRELSDKIRRNADDIDKIPLSNRIVEEANAPIQLTQLSFASKEDCALSGITNDYEVVGKLNTALDSSAYFQVDGFPSPSTDDKDNVLFTFKLRVTQSPDAEELRKKLEAAESEAPPADGAAPPPAAAAPPAEAEGE
ncbi:MAG TPA: hypothetical protein PKM88_12520, partial [bacterium]|nr:hypothetical protein [bacterium]